MYLGRIVAIGMTPQGKTAAMYRVSSRSFPNREAVLSNQQISILPRAGFESDLRKNPYISYNCVRLTGEWAIATNGSQTDPIAEKIATGYSPRDAISLGLMTLDYEKDSLDTPRIVAVVSNRKPVGFLGVVRKDALMVREFQLNPGEIRYISTYERSIPCDKQLAVGFVAPCENCAAQYIIDGGIFAEFENPITSAAALASEAGFALAVKVL